MGNGDERNHTAPPTSHVSDAENAESEVADSAREATGNAIDSSMANELGGDFLEDASDAGADAVEDQLKDAGLAENAQSAVGNSLRTIGDIGGGEVPLESAVGGTSRIGRTGITRTLERADVPGPVVDLLGDVVGTTGEAIGTTISAVRERRRSSTSDTVSNSFDAVEDLLGGEESHNVEMHFESTETDVFWAVDFATFTERLNSPYNLVLDLSTEQEDAEPALLLGISCMLRASNAAHT